MLVIAFTLLAIAAACVFVWHRRTFSYWRRHNIPHEPPRPFVGNFLPVIQMRTSFPSLLDHLYKNTPGANEDSPVVGLYAVWRPALLVRNIDLIKQILIKDFQSFHNRSMQIDPHVDMLGGNNLFMVRSPQWRDLRKQLTPVLSSGKMRQMYPLMCEVGQLLVVQLERLVEGKATVAQPPNLNKSAEETTAKEEKATEKHKSLVDSTSNATTIGVVDVKELCARFTMDLIASIAFGITANCLTDTHSEFYRYGHAIFEPCLSRALNFACSLLLPTLGWLTRVRVFPKPTAAFLRATFTRVMEQREREWTMRTGGKTTTPPTASTRNDLIDTLLALKWSAAVETTNKLKSLSEDKLNDYLLAQAALFQTAGFETSSSVLTFALFELAWQPQLQQRLREEIQKAFLKATDEGQKEATALSYEQLHDMQYLKQVVDETLRKYPIMPLIERSYTPLSKEEARAGYSLQPYADLTLLPGMTIYVSAGALHSDSKYWPEPELFDPDRFAPARLHEINWHAYLPFGSGPRSCIGSRMGLLTSRLGLVHMLRNHRVCICDRTQRVIECDPRSLPMSAKDGVFLRFERI